MAPALDGLPVWSHPDFAGGFRWYRGVASGRYPAKYLLARRVPCGVPLDSPVETLRGEVERLTPCLLGLREDARPGLPLPPVSLLDLLSALAGRMLSRCNFCRWDCGVDRAGGGGKQGACRLGSVSRVSSYFPHRGEESIYRGTGGSGTVFFTSCNMRCGFCQNGDISHDRDNGTPATPGDVAAMARQLRAGGCHNLNLVGGEPTVHLHTIVEALRLLPARPDPNIRDGVFRRGRASTRPDPNIRDGVFRRGRASEPRGRGAGFYRGELNVPVLWNSNFFMSGETMRILRCLVDIWLPDFKFGPGGCALRLARTPWYWETVTRNLEMVHGWGEEMTVRHLIMPGHVECCTRPVLEWLAARTPGAPVNLMDQYRPESMADPGDPRYREKYAEVSRRPTRDEIQGAYRIGEELGLRWRALSLEYRPWS